ncbi:MAG: SH3 domain-containing protein [Marinobacter sp.]|nr:SH3 domain-containing protein [Marinobacter sp.]
MSRIAKATGLLVLGWLLAACTEPPAVQPAPVVNEPAVLSVHTKPDNPQFHYIEGTLEADGLLLAYWETLYLEAAPVTLAEARPQQRLQLRFYPAPSERLTRLAGYAGVAEVSRILVYRGSVDAPYIDSLHTGYAPTETAALADVLAVFDDVPDGFRRYREGYVVQPVRARLQGFIRFVEGDHRFVYSRLSVTETLAGPAAGQTPVPDFNPDTYLGQPWRLLYSVAELTPLRLGPGHDTAVVTELPAGTVTVEKLTTVPGGWVRVQVVDSLGRLQSGYVPEASLWVIN